MRSGLLSVLALNKIAQVICPQVSLITEDKKPPIVLLTSICALIKMTPKPSTIATHVLMGPLVSPLAHYYRAVLAWGP
jgi:hypothetical protein